MYIDASRAETLEDLVRLMNDNITTSETSPILAVDEIFDNANQTAKEFKLVNDYFNSDLTGNNDKNLKKTVAAAVLIAKQMGVAPLALQNISTEQIVTTVDVGLTQAKVAYQTAQGVIEDGEEAIDRMIDCGAARVCTMIDEAVPALQDKAEKAVEVLIPQVINKVTTAIQSTIPELAPVMTVVREFTPYITERVKPLVRKGIAVVANVAKNVVHSVAGKVKSVARKIGRLLLS